MCRCMEWRRSVLNVLPILWRAIRSQPTNESWIVFFCLYHENERHVPIALHLTRNYRFKSWQNKLNDNETCKRVECFDAERAYNIVRYDLHSVFPFAWFSWLQQHKCMSKLTDAVTARYTEYGERVRSALFFPRKNQWFRRSNNECNCMSHF